MTSRRGLSLLIPTLALGLTLVISAAARADEASLSVTFGHSPHWVAVRGTHVREIRADERPDYDMFRYGNAYYAYNNNRWYMSHHSKGRFVAIADAEVPMEISRVPREHWHNYPGAWGDRDKH